MKDLNHRVCPVEKAGKLDTRLRRLLSNPYRLLKNYVKPGMKILDFGCGPGFFSIPMARMTGQNGTVYAVDLQPQMLNMLSHKVKGTACEQNILLHQCNENSIGVQLKIDFALAFYVVHEVPNRIKFFSELFSMLNPGGVLYISEPVFHVTYNEFVEMCKDLTGVGYRIIARPWIFLSRTIVVQKPV